MLGQRQALLPDEQLWQALFDEQGPGWALRETVNRLEHSRQIAQQLRGWAVQVFSYLLEVE